MNPIAVTASVLLLVGCQAPGTEHDTLSAVELVRVQAEVARAEHAVHSAVTATRRLAEPGGDVAAEYEAYAFAVDAVESELERVRGVPASLDAQRRAYVTAVAQAAGDAPGEPDAGAPGAAEAPPAEDGHGAVVADFDEVSLASGEARGAIDAWFEDLVAVRERLRQDLHAAEPLAAELSSLVGRGEELEAVLARLADRLGALVAAIGPVDMDAAGG